MKKIIATFMLLAVSQIAAAGTFSWKVTTSDLSVADLEGKIGDLISDKYVNKYPANKWTIYIMPSTSNAKASGSALLFVSVGVAPNGRDGKQPATKTWETNGRYSNFINATLKNKKPLIVEQVRLVLQDMMDACEKSPNCDIDK